MKEGCTCADPCGENSGDVNGDVGDTGDAADAGLPIDEPLTPLRPLLAWLPGEEGSGTSSKSWAQKVQTRTRE